MDKAGGDDLGADRRSYAEKNRQSGEARELRLVAFPEIAVEDLVAGAPQAALLEIHQQEGKVVKHVAGRDGIVEFHRVEQNRLAVDQGDIAKMKVAMAAAHIAGRPARDQQIPRRLQTGARIRRQTLGPLGLEEIGTGGKRLLVLIEIAPQRLRGGLAVAARRALVRMKDGEGELGDQVGRQRLAIGEPIERRVFVEPPHMDGPFDNIAGAPERQPACRACDRDGAKIDAWRVRPVDRDLGLAGGAALFKRREIHERETHGALDLVDVSSGQKQSRSMRVDAPHRRGEAERPGIAEEGKHLPLIRDGWRRRRRLAHFHRTALQAKASGSTLEYLAQERSRRVDPSQVARFALSRKMIHIKSPSRGGGYEGRMPKDSLAREVTVAVVVKLAVVIGAAFFIFGPKQRPVVDASSVQTRLIGMDQSIPQPRSPLP